MFKILVLRGKDSTNEDLFRNLERNFELVHTDSLPRAMALLKRDQFHGVFAEVDMFVPAEQVATWLQSGTILQAIADGVCLVDTEFNIVWANTEFSRWAKCDLNQLTGRPYYDALGNPTILGPTFHPLGTACNDLRPTWTRMRTGDNTYFQLNATPVFQRDSQVHHLIVLTRDVTAEVLEQQKIDALYQSAAEIADLEPEELAELTVAERIEVIKDNIQKYTREVLHFDNIEIRLVNHETNVLEVLLSDGMSPVATDRQLKAATTGHGITGYVAATGKSYLCPDIQNEPLYLPGRPDARSSLTVPLRLHNRIIGTLNVESEALQGFSERDLQFLEVFGRNVAQALNTYELLLAEKYTVASETVGSLAREVVGPVNDILTDVQFLLERFIGHMPEMQERLESVRANARSVKQAIRRSGERIQPPSFVSAAGEPDRPLLRERRILVVDDQANIRLMTNTVLSRYGCEVDTARNGAEALAMARANSYDVVLADIRLADMHGYEVFHQLRKLNPEQRVILVTGFGYDPTHSIVKARKEGLGAVLFKPFPVNKLLDEVEAGLQRSAEGQKDQKDDKDEND